ncbi:phosphoribosylamine--glycine ligase [Roseospirillum parvum]|uniref:Phosphoribosylamine--glycine ligase n=1 Tax=Roseospirillum parvum TaxID=83401 RepID=A0A1G7UI43_9PROT|nr:phosphoribosylamine--glycine ligase [Roseospirillum parvum]SDG47157.1 phosphoribosylamine--glycine ligase [Roseospirillum parvum]
MRILVVGGGGREHALCRALAAAPTCSALFCAPGNAGIAQVATCLPVGAEDIEALVACARAEAIDLVVVGPEAPLVKGLVDRLEAAGIRAFGPRAQAAELEGSKGYMKDLLARHDIPTAAYGRFTDPEAAKAFVHQQGAPIVVKADGLAAGKGVVICHSTAEAEATIDAMMTENAFGGAGAEVVVEEFLEGQEASFFALIDGEDVLPLGAAQDHKAVGAGDTGPNTGGMGAYAPTPAVDAATEAWIVEHVMRPTARAMVAEGRPFRGVLFAGLMITDSGIKVLEFNVRFGDPECQVLLARLNSDLAQVLDAACTGRLGEITLAWSPESAICVVMAANGYPGAVEKGSVIAGLADAEAVDGVAVLHAGTRLDEAGNVTAAGGRVLGITATGATLAEAHQRAYTAIDKLDWPGGFCRRDIGWRALM